MYIVISKSKINSNIETKECSTVQAALELMQFKTGRDFECKLAKIIPTQIEKKITVTLVDEH